MIDIYESFENLDDIKKQNIINAGFRIFGEYGYSKASIADIIREAGISKGSLFYYFGSKRNYFLYIYKYAVDISKKMIDTSDEDRLTEYYEIRDFFDRLEYVKKRKMELTIQYPYMSNFIKKAAFESSKDVNLDVQLVNQKLINERTFYNIDLNKFKDGINPTMVLQLLSWCSEGVVNQIKLKNMANPNKISDDIDYKEVIHLYDQYVSMIRENFYKDEYL